MPSFFRRAGAEILRILASVADPSTDSTSALAYAKSDTGTKQIYAKDSDGLIYQVTPAIGLCKAIFYYCDDFANSTTSNSVVAGTGTNLFTTAVQGSPGIVRQSATATATPDRAVEVPATSMVTAFIPGGNVTVWEGRCRTPTAQDGTDQWTDRWGMSDSTTGDATDGIYFESDRALNGDNNVRLCCAAGGARTKTTMGVAPTAGTFQRWKWICNAAATSVQGYLNDVATGTPVVANIPTASTGIWLGMIIKTLGPNLRSVDRDYFETYQIFSPTTR